MSAPIERPLTDEERQLLVNLAVRQLAEQAGCTLGEANDVLAELAARGELLFTGDNESVRVVTNAQGGWLVQAARDWLAFHASWPDQ
jgi:hypothetical protein